MYDTEFIITKFYNYLSRIRNSNITNPICFLFPLKGRFNVNIGWLKEALLFLELLKWNPNLREYFKNFVNLLSRNWSQDNFWVKCSFWRHQMRKEEDLLFIAYFEVPSFYFHSILSKFLHSFIIHWQTSNTRLIYVSRSIKFSTRTPNLTKALLRKDCNPASFSGRLDPTGFPSVRSDWTNYDEFLISVQNELVVS